MAFEDDGRWEGLWKTLGWSNRKSRGRTRSHLFFNGAIRFAIGSRRSVPWSSPFGHARAVLTGTVICLFLERRFHSGRKTRLHDH